MNCIMLYSYTTPTNYGHHVCDKQYLLKRFLVRYKLVYSELNDIYIILFLLIKFVAIRYKH